MLGKYCCFCEICNVWENYDISNLGLEELYSYLTKSHPNEKNIVIKKNSSSNAFSEISNQKVFENWYKETNKDGNFFCRISIRKINNQQINIFNKNELTDRAKQLNEYLNNLVSNVEELTSDIVSLETKLDLINRFVNPDSTNTNVDASVTCKTELIRVTITNGNPFCESVKLINTSQEDWSDETTIEYIPNESDVVKFKEKLVGTVLKGRGTAVILTFIIKDINLIVSGEHYEIKGKITEKGGLTIGKDFPIILEFNVKRQKFDDEQLKKKYQELDEQLHFDEYLNINEQDIYNWIQEGDGDSTFISNKLNN